MQNSLRQLVNKSTLFVLKYFLSAQINPPAKPWKELLADARTYAKTGLAKVKPQNLFISIGQF